ncbi:MAG: tetratricopeptide repeat protein [bacterium]|nr:tetratricopeptide repeat protein [bacterium]
MPVFLATCVETTGMETVESVEAEDIKLAREALEARGYSEIVFEHDSERYGCSEIKDLTAAQQKEVLRSGSVPFSVWAVVWGKNLGPFALWAGIVIWGGAPYSVFDRAGIGMFAFVGAAAFVLGIPLHLYNCLLAASAWHRWDRMLALAKLLRPVATAIRLRPLLVDIRIRTARALIAKGRLREAFELVDDLRDPATELGRVADLCWASGARDDAIALKRRAAEATPERADGWIDYAGILLEAHRAREARAALDKARTLEITAMAQLFCQYTQGVIELEDGDANEAVRCLESAIEGLSEYSGNPLVHVGRLRWTAFLALALAKNGDQERARECFEASETLLIATDETELLDRCRATVANVVS